MSIANKILICLCCSHVACSFATCYDQWASTEACGLGCIQCAGCCWTICAPLCHSFSCGNFGGGIEYLIKGGKHCLYGWLVSCVSPFDGCINCVLYNIKNFQSGVSGASDIQENCKKIAKILEGLFGVQGSNEPDKTFKTYSP